LTLEQQQPGGGIAVPVNAGDDGVATPQSEIDIDLGSAFASELGFPPSVKMYVETEDESVASIPQSSSPSPSKKKKKKSKKKKGKK
jgi:hypothetical protein